MTSMYNPDRTQHIKHLLLRKTHELQIIQLANTTVYLKILLIQNIRINIILALPIWRFLIKLFMTMWNNFNKSYITKQRIVNF